MAQDIDFSSCKYYTELIPPISNTVGYELSQEWGSRIAVHSGRAHGLTGMGTVLAAGTYIDFPSGYFSNLPCIEVSEVIPANPYTTISPLAGLAFFARVVANSPYTHVDYGYISVNGFWILPTVDSVVSWFAKGV
jgi:hypothetical protein